MPEPALIDHLVVIAMVLLDPLAGVWWYRRMVRRVRAGDANARAAFYRKSMLLSWTSTIGLVTIWLGAGRPAAALGFAAPGDIRLLIGATITVIGLALLYTQWRAVLLMDAKGLEAVRAQLAAVAELLPRTEKEGALFRGVSVTAGVCEEIVCRGFLIWYLAAYIGPWPAVFLGAMMFGLLHLYQGSTGVIRTGATGLVMGILYVASGSLLWPVILHTAVDVHGGAVARHVLRSVPRPQAA